MKLKRIENTGTSKKKIRKFELDINKEYGIQKLKTSLGKVTNLKNGDQIKLSEGTALVVVEKNEILLYCDRPDTYTLDVEAETELSSARIKDLKRFALNYTKFNQSKDLKQKAILLDLSPMRFRFECNLPTDCMIQANELQIRFYGFVTVQINNPFLFLSNIEQIYPKWTEVSVEECFRIYKGEIVDLIIEWLQNQTFDSLEEIKEKQREMFEFCRQRFSSNPVRDKGVRFIDLAFTEVLPTAESRSTLECRESNLLNHEDIEENGWDSMF